MAGLLDLFGGSNGSQDASGGGLGNGLLGLYSNPDQASALGFFNGLLQASGPSRIPINLGQVISGGLQGATQGLGSSLGMQRQLMTLRALQGLMGGSSATPGQSPAPGQNGPTGAPVSGAANTGAMSGLSAGLGAFAPQAQPQAVPASAAAPQPGAIFGKTPQQLWQQGMLMNFAGIPGGSDMMKMAAQYDPSLQAMLPTDATKYATQAGDTPEQIQAANAGALKKANYIPPTALRTPVYFDPQTGTTQVVPADQLKAGYGTMYNAENRARANFKPMQAWDPTANGGRGGFVYQTAANLADAANGGAAPGATPTAAAATPASAPAVPLGIRNNNFGNIKGADGQFATYSTPQAGIDAADQLLATYGGKYGINTLTGIANRWSPAGDGNNDPAAKAAAMAAATGLNPNQPINLNDPAVRARVLPALFDTETPGWRGALAGGAASGAAPTSRAPMAAQPPLGQSNAANASQGAPSKQMADSFGDLSDADENYQQSRQDIVQMLKLAQSKGLAGTAAGLLPEGIGTKLSASAAEYQKLHADYVSQQGKSLGAGGTDASRATIDESVPGYDKPQSAMEAGLTNQLNRLDMMHLKTQFLAPVYQQGNEKTYTQQNAAFDRNITPEMMPVLQLSGEQQRAAVQAAIKANPAMRANYEWAFNNGMLK